MRYRAKPVEIEAYEWAGDLAVFPAEWRQLNKLILEVDGSLTVLTNRGPTTAWPGDFVIRGRSGELYPIDAPTFHDKYEAAQAVRQ